MNNNMDNLKLNRLVFKILFNKLKMQQLRLSKLFKLLNKSKKILILKWIKYLNMHNKLNKIQTTLCTIKITYKVCLMMFKIMIWMHFFVIKELTIKISVYIALETEMEGNNGI